MNLQQPPGNSTNFQKPKLNKLECGLFSGKINVIIRIIKV
jgi:hypothetical protein